MSGPYQLLVFDWDGTLVDSTALIAESILCAAEDIGVPVPDRSQASHVIGLGLLQALARVVPDLPPDRIPAFAAAYHLHYRRREDDIRLFGGARELIEALHGRGVQLAIATGKTRLGLARALERAQLAPFFDALRCADQTHPKPHPAMLLELSEELMVPAERMVMIGDTTHDLQMAAAARVAGVGVCQGAHGRAAIEEARPTAVFDRLADAAPWLLERAGAARA